MGAHTIILKKPGLPTLISPGVVSILDASGFDTITARYIDQTTATAVTLAKAPGTTQNLPQGFGNAPNMIFMGVSDCADLPGNCCEYTMTWRGLLVTLAGRNTQVTETRSIRERLFDTITGIPGAPASSRGRLLEQQSGMTVRSIVTTKPDPPDTKESNSQSPVQGINNPSKGYTVINDAKTYCYPHGWICYSWQSEQPIPGIWFVTAEYKFEHPTSSG